MTRAFADLGQQSGSWRRLTSFPKLFFLVLLTILFLLGGCSSASNPSSIGSQPPMPPKSKTSTTPSTTTTTSTTTPGPAYQTIGGFNATLAQGLGGGSVTITYELGQPIINNQAPSAAADLVSACSISDTMGTVWIPGQVSVEFHGGPYSQQITFGPGTDIQHANGLVGANLSDGELLEAVQAGGQWYCGGPEDTSSNSGFELNMNPSETETLPMWVVAVSAVNNTTPNFSESANPDWSFGSLVQDGPGTTDTPFGPSRRPVR